MGAESSADAIGRTLDGKPASLRHEVSTVSHGGAGTPGFRLGVLVRTRPGVRGCGAGLLLLALTACQPAVLYPVGPVGLGNKTLLLDSLVIMLAIVVPTILATLGFAWWFRASNPHAKRLTDWAYSGQIELVTWAIPLLTITLLGGVTWVGAHQLDPARPLESKEKALEVQVVSLDWKWLFIYPDQQVASVNELMVPAGRPVHFTLTSASVMNAFFVPQFGSMIYVMNGMTSDLNLQADQPGTYRGLSSHYSGDGFSGMHFAVQALDAAGFDAWVQATRKVGPSLDTASYTELAKQTIGDPPSVFRTVEPGLFQKIVSQELAPGPGPDPQPHPKSTASMADPAASPAANLAVGALAAAAPGARQAHAMEH